MRKLLSLFLFVTFVAFAMSGCGPSPPPAATPIPSTPTSVPPTPTPPIPTDTPMPATPTPLPPMTLTSSAFEPGGEIPIQYSCDGENLSPPLGWSGMPEGAQSLLLFAYDPDAGAESGASVPQGFVHWIAYNIPPSTTGYPEGMPGGDTLGDGALQGSNDFADFAGEAFPGGATIKGIGYDGPCPGNQHRYVFALYALDALLDLPAGAAMAEVLGAMEGHIMAQAELMGLYAPPQ